VLDHDELDALSSGSLLCRLPGVALVYKSYFDVFTCYLLYLRSQLLYLSTLLLVGRRYHQRKEQPQGVYGGMDF
jgi:hypothetical protein